jgi:hypothetical protein
MEMGSRSTQNPGLPFARHVQLLNISKGKTDEGSPLSLILLTEHSKGGDRRELTALVCFNFLVSTA